MIVAEKESQPTTTSTMRAVPRADVQEPPWLQPLIDVLLALASFVLGYLIRYELQILRPVFELNRAPFEPYLPYALFFAVWLHFSYRSGGLYRPARGRSFFDELAVIVNGVTGATVILLAISFVLQPTVFSRLMFLYVAAASIVLLAIARIVRRTILARLRAQGIGVLRVLVVGSGDVGRAVLRTLIARKEHGYMPIGYLDEDAQSASVDLGRVKGLGGLGNLEAVLAEHQVNYVVVTLPWSNHDRIIDLIERCRRANVDVSVVPDLFQLNLRQLRIENLDGVPLLRVEGPVSLQAGQRLLKRLLDLGIIIVTAPVILLVCTMVAIAIRLEGAGPIFYSQLRVGENGRRFKMIKFRSMVPDADRLRGDLIKEHGLDPRHAKIKDDPRMTRVGRFIRRMSLDELPNAINVLLGQMSVVGPRPPTPDEVLLYASWHTQRLQVKPGITGLWQVSGRSEVPFDEMCLLDIYYIENWSLRLDMQIVLMTIPRVLLRKGAY
ncbi:MAG: sugar transferase [Chloroflexi bacterium]|nr:sugar transferase [Chloroflexota bacterium]